MVETIQYLYTSQTEITAKLSGQMADFVTDNDQSSPNPAPAVIWSDVVNEATDVVNFHLSNLYNESDMVNNAFVRRLATWIGCYLVTLERADPGRFKTQYDRSIKMLKLIAEGKRQLPRLGYRCDLSPVMSNHAIDDRFIINKDRVEQSNSTGGTSSRQDGDIVYPGYPF